MGGVLPIDGCEFERDQFTAVVAAQDRRLENQSLTDTQCGHISAEGSEYADPLRQLDQAETERLERIGARDNPPEVCAAPRYGVHSVPALLSGIDVSSADPQFWQRSLLPSAVSPQLPQRLPVRVTAARSSSGKLKRPSRTGAR